jgi:hypothetical protein
VSREELVTSYLDGGMSRRTFIRRLVAAGVSVGAAVSYAHLLAPAARAAAGTDGDLQEHYEPEIRVAIRGGLRRVLTTRKLEISASADDPVTFSFKTQIRHKGRLKTVGEKQVVFSQAATNRIIQIPISRFGRTVLAGRETSWIKVVGVASYAQLQPAGTYTSRAVATKVLS